MIGAGKAYDVLKNSLDPKSEASKISINSHKIDSDKPITVMDIITVLGLSKSVGRRVAVQGGISINDIGLEMPDGLSIEVKEGEIVKFGRHSGAVYLGDGNIIRVTVEI